jgi:hypothetical protein
MTANFCIMEGCDQEPQYCVGHYNEVCFHEMRNLNKVQQAHPIVRALLTHLERLGVENRDIEEARAWLK